MGIPACGPPLHPPLPPPPQQLSAVAAAAHDGRLLHRRVSRRRNNNTSLLAAAAASVLPTCTVRPAALHTADTLLAAAACTRPPLIRRRPSPILLCLRRHRRRPIQPAAALERETFSTTQSICRSLPTHRSPIQVHRDGIFKLFKNPRNRFQGIDSASLCSLTGLYSIQQPHSYLVPNPHGLF